MARTGHPNFVYRISSPWRARRHTWSLTANHSGSSFNSGDAETFMTGSSSPFALCYAHFLSSAPASGSTYAASLHQVVGAAYYNGSDSAPVWEAIYDGETPPPSTLMPVGDASSIGSASAGYGSLEACAELRAPVGMSRTNKPVYVRKFIHGLPSSWVSTNVDGVQTMPLSTEGTAAIESQSNNSWFGSRVYIARSGNQPSAASWEAIPGAHQMPRGRRKVTTKAGSSAQSTLLGLLENGLIGAGAAALEDLL